MFTDGTTKLGETKPTEAEKRLIEAESKLVEALEETDEGVMNVAPCLDALQSAVPVLVGLLADREPPQVRGSTVRLSGYYGSVAQKAHEGFYEAGKQLKEAGKQLKETGKQLKETGKQQLNQAETQWLKDAEKLIEKAEEQLRTDTQERLDGEKERGPKAVRRNRGTAKGAHSQRHGLGCSTSCLRRASQDQKHKEGIRGEMRNGGHGGHEDQGTLGT